MDTPQAQQPELSHNPNIAPPEGITPRVVSGEIGDFLRSHERRRRQLPRAVIVGFLTGLVAVAFRTSLDRADQFRTWLIHLSHNYAPLGILIPIIYGAVGAGAGVWLVQKVAPAASGSGIPHLKAVLHRLKEMRWARILLVKFFGGILSIGGGLALGREGPTIQMGGCVGQMVSRWLGSTPRERQTLIAAGAGAGLAAAFNAPLSGLVFVLEEVQRDFTPAVFTAAFVASVTADLVARLILGQLPVFHVAPYPPPPLSTIPVFLVLGLLTGLLGVVFNRALLGSLRLFERTSGWPAGAVGALVGACVGLIGWFVPDALGGGHPLVEQTLSGRVALGMIPLFFLLRFALFLFSYGTGAPGGIFAPLLVLGAQVGLFVGLIAHQWWPQAVPEATMFAVVGMAAYFTAIVRAPLTGIVLILEMTGSQSLMLPLLAACFTAYGMADLLGDRPIYEALLERDLLRGQENPELEGTLLLELPVLAGAPFAGKSITELALPPGCLIITVCRGVKTEVPTSNTRLQVGDRITAVISPSAAHATVLLREGTEPGHHATSHAVTAPSVTD